MPIDPDFQKNMVKSGMEEGITILLALTIREIKLTIIYFEREIECQRVFLGQILYQ